MKSRNKLHPLRYETFRIAAIGIAGLLIVFAISMLMEFRILRSMKATVENGNVFSIFYEELEQAEKLLREYINTEENSSRFNCAIAGEKLKNSSFLLAKTFKAPRFTDNDYLTQTYIEIYNEVLVGSDSDKLSNYYESEKIYGYLCSNEDELNTIRTSLTFQAYQAQYTRWQRQFIVIAVMIVLFGIYMLLICGDRTDRLAEPLLELTQRMELFRKEGPENQILEEWNKEVYPEKDNGEILVAETSSLQETFSDMVKTIREQMEELKEKIRLNQEVKELQLKNVQMEVSLKDTEMKLIQSLISPHFLFNCLNTVSGLAYIEKAPKTREASQMIAVYLRNSIQLIGKNIPLSEEIKHTNEYISIQQLRFQDRIQFNIVSDGMNGNVKVPSMLLQPLVENSISHGMKSMLKNGVIDVTIQTEKGRVILMVCDNGDGIPWEKMQKVQSELKNPQLGPTEYVTGLYGVAARLWTIYGDKATIEIESGTGKGTRILIGLPGGETSREGL